MTGRLGTCLVGREREKHMNLASIIDHTNLKADATKADLVRLCDEAKRYGFASVAINGCWTASVSEWLAGSGVGITTCVGFPLGAAATAGKAAEAHQAVIDGTTELDMVINVGKLIDGDDNYVVSDIAEVVRMAEGRPVKVILECCLLDDEQIVRACEDCVEAGASFVKTSTGFGTGGATVHDVELMRRTVGERCKVKAAGGIHSRQEAEAMVKAGADRLGVSASIAIIGG